jgi:hypothetical protein
MKLILSSPRNWSKIQKLHKPASKLTIEWLSAQLDLARMRNNCEAISSLHLGLDTTFASLCANKGIPLTVVLSCKQQDKFWDESNKKTYNYLLSKAKEVDYGPELYKENCIADQLQKIDLWLTKGSSTLFLVKYQSLSKGQSNRLAYARQHGSQIITYRIKP